MLGQYFSSFDTQFEGHFICTNLLRGLPSPLAIQWAATGIRTGVGRLGRTIDRETGSKKMERKTRKA